MSTDSETRYMTLIKELESTARDLRVFCGDLLNKPFTAITKQLEEAADEIMLAVTGLREVDTSSPKQDQFRCYELELNGYQGGTDRYDHLIKWVLVEGDAEVLTDYLAKVGLELHWNEIERLSHCDNYLFADGIDLIVNASGAASWDSEKANSECELIGRWLLESTCAVRDAANKSRN